MQPPAQTFPVLSFIGVVVQFGGAVLLVALFLLLRQFVLRRGYFSAWTSAWMAVAIAVLAIATRYVFLPGLAGGALPDRHPAVRTLYFIYQAAKGLGFVFFLRGTALYVAGRAAGPFATTRLSAAATAFALVSTVVSRQGLNEMVVWQAAIAVPVLGYCASAFLWLPRPRRTVGSVATGVSFALIALLWLLYAGAFGLAIRNAGGPIADLADRLISFNAYADLALNVVLGYSMILVLMEDSKREFDAAQAELRVTHDQLRRAALYDSLTDSLNRRAFAEGVGLEMVRATFGTVVLADLDNLKLVNDRLGHMAGDQIIRRCADVLRAMLRPYDKLYRWGGDEFLLIVPSARAADVLARLQLAMDAEPPIEVGLSPEDVRLQLSMGAADYSSAEDLGRAIERADQAMYQEKARRKRDPRSGGSPFVTNPTPLPAVR